MKWFCILLYMILLLSGCGNGSTEPTAENPSRMAEIKDEVLSAFGLNYYQMEDQYGKTIDAGYWRGGYFYCFNNAKGCYFFGTNDESLPAETDLCWSMMLAVSDFFSDTHIEYTFEEIQSKYSFQFVESEKSFEEMDSFETIFLFEDYEIVFITTSSEKVMPDDWLYIHKIAMESDVSDSDPNTSYRSNTDNRPMTKKIPTSIEGGEVGWLNANLKTGGGGKYTIYVFDDPEQDVVFEFKAGEDGDIITLQKQTENSLHNRMYMRIVSSDGSFKLPEKSRDTQT